MWVNVEPLDDPHIYQFLVGAIAQLVEHCTSIAEVRVCISVQTFLATYLHSTKNCEDHSNSFQSKFTFISIQVQIHEFHCAMKSSI